MNDRRSMGVRYAAQRDIAEGLAPGPDDEARCPKCGELSASYPAEVYCVECATEGWERDAAEWRISTQREDES